MSSWQVLLCMMLLLIITNKGMIPIHRSRMQSGGVERRKAEAQHVHKFPILILPVQRTSEVLGDGRSPQP